jgi:hypothetical protein
MSGMSNNLGPIGTVLGAVAGYFTGGTSYALSAGSMIGGAAGSVAGNALAKPPPMPEIPKPITMPDQSMIDQARQKSIAETMQRRGRASTILTDSASQSKLG